MTPGICDSDYRTGLSRPSSYLGTGRNRAWWRTKALERAVAAIDAEASR